MGILSLVRGVAANDGTGTPLRDGADIINSNFNLLLSSSRSTNRYENMIVRGNLPDGLDGVSFRTTTGWVNGAAPAPLAAFGIGTANKIPSGTTAQVQQLFLHTLKSEQFGMQAVIAFLFYTTGPQNLAAKAYPCASDGHTLGPEIPVNYTPYDLGSGVHLSIGTLTVHSDTSYPYLAFGNSGISPAPTADSPLSDDIYVSGWSAAFVYGTPYPEAFDFLDYDAWNRVGKIELQDQIGVIQDNVTSLQASQAPDYLRNVWPHGDMDSVPDGLVYTGSGVLESVADVPELAALGIHQAYRPTPPAGSTTASQVRFVNATAAALGIQAGDHVLLGSFLYSSDGVTWPPGHANQVMVDGASTVFGPSTQYLQVSDHVRFYWGTGVMPAGTQQAIIIGFTSTRFAESDSVRYHSGFIAHAQADALPAITLTNLPKLLGWDGQGPAAEFYADVQGMLDAYNDGSLIQNLAAKVVLGGDDGDSYIEVVRDGHRLRRVVAPFPTPTLTTSSVFNFIDDQVDGVSIKPTSDDPAPYRVLGTTVGGNHGYAMSLLDAAGHGKTQADAGSVYSDGVNEHVIVAVVDADHLYAMRRDTNAYTPAGTLTWVSGGVDHDDITATDTTNSVLYPPFNGRSIRVFVDGVEVVDHRWSGVYNRTVSFVESYGLLARADVVASVEANAASGQIVPSGDPSAVVTITYNFDYEGNCTINTDFTCLKDGVPIQDIMFLQSQRMATGVDGDIRYYIPKTLPVEWSDRTYNYALIDDTDTTAWTDRLSFTPAHCEPDGLLPDRAIQLSDHYGFAIGYLPVQSTAPEVRRANASVKALQLSTESCKIYLSAIDRGVGTLNAGDYFSTIGYRNLLLRDAARTASYAVRINSTAYFYADWHDIAGLDLVPLPVDLAGRDFEIVEKYNVDVMSQSLTSRLVVNVNATGSYGYLIMKITS